MFQKLKKCLCRHHYEPIGFYYKESLSLDKNAFDKVKVYHKYVCIKCLKINDMLVSTEEFAPELYFCGRLEKINYISNLKKKGVKQEVDLYL